MQLIKELTAKFESKTQELKSIKIRNINDLQSKFDDLQQKQIATQKSMEQEILSLQENQRLRVT